MLRCPQTPEQANLNVLQPPQAMDLNACHRMDFTWGPVIAARIGYLLERASKGRGWSAERLSMEFELSWPFGYRAFRGDCSRAVAVRIGEVLGVDVLATVVQIRANPKSYAIPRLLGTRKWCALNRCQDIWKLDTLRPFLLAIRDRYNGRGAGDDLTTLNGALRAASHLHGRRLTRDNVFVSLCATYRELAALAVIAEVTLPPPDRYARMLRVLPAAAEVSRRRGPGVSPL